MPRRKAPPPVARPTGRQRFIELCKDVLILALTCSALFLAGQTPLFTQLRGWVSPPAKTAEPVTRQLKEAVEPYGVAARNSMGLYGAVYDATQVDRAFGELSPLLGEALSAAGAPETITRRQWERLLEAPGVYCVFQGAPPLQNLSAWLGQGGGTLTGGAQALLLAWDGSQVWLCWREGSSYRRASTQVAYEGHMDLLLESFSPNGVAYAHALAQTDPAYASIDPDVLVPMTAPQLKGYTVSTPDFAGAEEDLEKLLAALGFQSGVSSAYEAGGGLALNENGDRLRVGSDGSVIFHAGEELRYPVAAQNGRSTAEEAVTAAWDLLNRAAAPWKGEELAFVLTGAEETGESWTVTFHSRLNGVPLQTGAESWSAQFTVSNGQVTDFTLLLRSYTATGENLLFPGQRLAAAAMGAETYRQSGRRLTLCYHDRGGGVLTAGWVAEE